VTHPAELPHQKRGARISLAARLRYRFDAVMSRGVSVVILWLTIVTVAFVLVVALFLTLFDVGINQDADPTFVERFWQAFIRILDPGTFSGDAGWSLRIPTLAVTLLGVVVGASLIGLVVAAVDRKVEELRRGRSSIIERGHTVILGWSPRVFTLVSEIIVANQNQPRGCIAILAPKDKTEMEESLRARIGGTGRTRLVCRTGEPSNPRELPIVNVAEARSVVVLAGGDDKRIGDAQAVKAVLAVMSGDPSLERSAVVVELDDAETARALQEAGRGRVLPVRAADVIARITAQACRQAGLSSVCRDLLDFDSDEIYFEPAPELAGHTFGEALLAYDRSSVIGRLAADGTIAVNPPMDTMFEAGDSVIAISQDDDTVVFSGFRDEAGSQVVTSPVSPERSERLLIVGWNQLGPLILEELDRFVPPGSDVDVLADADLVDPGKLTAGELEHLRTTFQPTDGKLDRLISFAIERRPDKVIILGYRSGLSPEEADARTLLTLLLLRRGLAAHPQHRARIVTELLDSRDVELAEASGADDFVVSDELSSLMLAQLSERTELEPVLVDLLDVGDSALALRPSERYLAEPAPFARVVAAARVRGEVAIGYRQARGADGRPHVRLNPPKSETVALDGDDQVVVIAPV
jgi:voltage-gated potassium channel Kch